jgi:DNA invertase Pin-like site-specific DNA recombinase
MNRNPVAYLRKSKVTSDRHVSWETQEAAVRALAARQGDTGILTILSDWSKSGRLGAARRPGYAELVRLIEADEVSTVYSYSLARLSRSLPDFRALVDLCIAHKTGIRLEADDLPDINKASGLLVLSIISAVAEFEAAITKERAADSMAARLARGDRLGAAPYGAMAGEPIEPITAAFRQAGSSFGAARLLNAAGARTRRGALWTGKVVGDVLAREGVIARRHPKPGVKPSADWVTFQLLTCQCGQVMTPLDHRSPRVTCYKARQDPDHPRPHGIALSRLLPALQAEAARLRTPEAVEAPVEDQAERMALDAKRERVLDMFADGLIDKVERARRLVAIEERLNQLDAAREVVAIPGAIDWSWPPKEINAVLRAMWSRVELGPDLMPRTFVWRAPEWRAGTETQQTSVVD